MFLLIYSFINLTITVDASRAGIGELEVYIKSSNKKVPVKVVEKTSSVYRAHFMPKEPLRHLVFVLFTKEPVPGQKPFNYNSITPCDILYVSPSALGYAGLRLILKI